ncbi:hypothetical protein J1G43_14470 [Cellulomonas sp. zg-ZUI22]|uniref:hypothetical protein n=1 Tax=Cellulomonas sp. zg-ZUI22 TaxID=2816955 RepID=UPI001A948259|nr:hypothetical protein [Cellulomonas sp. zg-ZUI22]MBO0901167.1 hypothetical protein [Cellulomonas sp. zg-ZUI22]
MDDLARFIVMRPPDLPTRGEVKVLEPPSIDTTAGRRPAAEQARDVLRSEHAVRRVEDLRAGSVAVRVQHVLSAGHVPLAVLADAVEAVGGRDVATVVADETFGTEEGALADTLVATKILSGWPDVDAAGLAAAAQGYDALRRASQGEDPVGLRPLQMPGPVSPRGEEPHGGDPRPGGGDEPRPGGGDGPRPDGGTDSRGDDRPGREDPHLREARVQEARLGTALRALRGLRADAFAAGAGADDHRTGQPAAVPAGSTSRAAAGPAVPHDTDLSVRSPWLLRREAVDDLPTDVRGTLADAGIDPAAVPLPQLVEQVEALRLAEAAVVRDLSAGPRVRGRVHVGAGWLTEPQDDDWVGTPTTGMPTGHGDVKSVGIGELLLIKQHVLRYEGGELAHVENVLRSEHLSRETRRLDRTETTILTESEHTQEDERDTQTTDRFSLKRETTATLAEESTFTAGVQVTAKYGPFVEVEASAELGTASSSEETAKQSTEFGKDVVTRAASKVVDRVLERRSTTTVTEFEEKYGHGFDNTAGSGNISGVYQWVDKVVQAQVYSYGKRMLFDITVPEPATAFLLTQSAPDDGTAPQPPVPFTITSDQVTEAEYPVWARRYDVGGLEAPPPPVKTLSKAFAGVFAEGDHESSASGELVVDEGYEARYALFQRSMSFYDDHVWRVMVGSNWIDAFSATGYVDMASEVGSVAYAYHARQVRSMAATVEIFCQRTARATKAWQLKTHAALTQGYLAKLQQYESRLAEAEAQAGVVIAGRNPLWNQRLVATELRKQALTVLTAQHFDAFGALELSSQGYAQPDLVRTAQQMPYVRFLEQAFEWEHLVHFCYPYFWGWKPAWKQRMLLDDVDPQFADFLRAGAARVVVPVRPGFEAAVSHYLERGKIWNGGPAPTVNDSTYLPIVKEIQAAQGAPGDERPVGEPWLVRLPTTLVKLRPDDELPSWHKVDEDWQPVE